MKWIFIVAGCLAAIVAIVAIVGALLPRDHVELLPATATGPSWREHGSNGAITIAIEAADRPRRLVGRIADQNLPFGGTWEYRIEPEGDTASLVTVVERGRVYNPIFRFVSRFIMGQTRTIDAYLRALAKRFGRDTTRTVVAATGVSHGI